MNVQLFVLFSPSRLLSVSKIFSLLPLIWSLWSLPIYNLRFYPSNSSVYLEPLCGIWYSKLFGWGFGLTLHFLLAHHMICEEVEFPAIPGLARLPMQVAVMPFVRTSPDSTHWKHQRRICLLGCLTWIEARRSLIAYKFLTTWARTVDPNFVKH